MKPVLKSSTHMEPVVCAIAIHVDPKTNPAMEPELKDGTRNS